MTNNSIIDYVKLNSNTLDYIDRNLRVFQGRVKEHDAYMRLKRIYAALARLVQT